MASQAVVRTLSSSGDVTCHLAWYPPDFAQDAHVHEAAQVSLLIAGELRECAHGGEHASDRPSIARKPAGARHSVVFGPHGAVIMSWQVQGGDVHRPELPERRSDWQWQCSRRLQPLLGLVAAGASPCAQPLAPADDLLWDLLALIAEDDAAPIAAMAATAPPFMARIREQLRFDPASFSVRGAARDAGVHRIHLARLFLRHFGSTITACRRRSLAGAALRHILDPAKTLTAAALDAGFADQSHMTRMLKAETGFTPGALRRAMLGRGARA